MKDDRIEHVGTTILSDRHWHLGEGCTYDRRTDTAYSRRRYTRAGGTSRQARSGMMQHPILSLLSVSGDLQNCNVSPIIVSVGTDGARQCVGTTGAKNKPR
jgi:hypothetical protein